MKKILNCRTRRRKPRRNKLSTTNKKKPGEDIWEEIPNNLGKQEKKEVNIIENSFEIGRPDVDYFDFPVMIEQQNPKTIVTTEFLESKNSHEKILTLTTNKRRNFLMKKKKKELLEIACGFGYEKNEKKKLIVDFILKNNPTRKLKKTGRPKGKKLPKTIEGLKLLSVDVIERDYNLVCSNIHRKWENLTFWKRFENMNDFIIIYEKYALFYFNNSGWGSFYWNKEVYELIRIYPEFIQRLQSHFPTLRPDFSKKWNDIMENVKIANYFEHISECLILKKYTKAGFCRNRLCGDKCTFRYQIQLKYNHEKKLLSSEIWIIGGHTRGFMFYEGFTKDVPLSIRHKWSVYSDQYLFLRDRTTFKTKHVAHLNSALVSCNNPTRKQIYNKRYYMRKQGNNFYQTCFSFAVTEIKAGNYKHLELYSYSVQEMQISFIIKPDKINQVPEIIKVIYYDGTFKAKFRGNHHYVVLVFATMGKTGFLIPLGVAISFRGKGEDYGNLFIGIKKKYISKGYSFQKACFIADFGSSETKFAGEFDQFRKFLCWYHIERILTGWINMYGSSEKSRLTKLIRMCYSAKTDRYLSVIRNKIRLVLKRVPKLNAKISRYFSDWSLLKKWISILKISIFRDHGNNYIEQSFSPLNKFTGRKTVRVNQLLEYYNSYVFNLQLDLDNNEKHKKDVMLKSIIAAGRKMVLEKAKIVRIEFGIYSVESSQPGKFYRINVIHYYCTCMSFNVGILTKFGNTLGRGCKHMGSIIVKSLDSKYSKEEQNSKSLFELFNLFRILHSVSSEFKQMIRNSYFPVTISEKKWKMIE